MGKRRAVRREDLCVRLDENVPHHDLGLVNSKMYSHGATQ